MLKVSIVPSDHLKISIFFIFTSLSQQTFYFNEQNKEQKMANKEQETKLNSEEFLVLHLSVLVI